jgi:hypothetical protein
VKRPITLIAAAVAGLLLLSKLLFDQIEAHLVRHRRRPSLPISAMKAKQADRSQEKDR